MKGLVLIKDEMSIHSHSLDWNAVFFTCKPLNLNSIRVGKKTDSIDSVLMKCIVEIQKVEASIKDAKNALLNFDDMHPNCDLKNL